MGLFYTWQFVSLEQRTCRRHRRRCCWGVLRSYFSLRTCRGRGYSRICIQENLLLLPELRGLDEKIYIVFSLHEYIGRYTSLFFLSLFSLISMKTRYSQAVAPRISTPYQVSISSYTSRRCTIHLYGHLLLIVACAFYIHMYTSPKHNKYIYAHMNTNTDDGSSSQGPSIPHCCLLIIGKLYIRETPDIKREDERRVRLATCMRCSSDGAAATACPDQVAAAKANERVGERRRERYITGRGYRTDDDILVNQGVHLYRGKSRCTECCTAAHLIEDFTRWCGELRLYWNGC